MISIFIFQLVALKIVDFSFCSIIKLEIYFMDYPQVYEYLKYQGRELEYLDENGEKQSRVLENITYDSMTREATAYFRYDNLLARFLKEAKKVPLSRVLLPDTYPISEEEEEMQRKKISGNDVYLRQLRSKINYYGEYYEVTSSGDFQPGDEVVWTTYSGQQEAFFGKIVVCAEREGIMRTESVAVVSLNEMPPSRNGGLPPRFFNYRQDLKNTCLIPIKELLKLDVWVVSMSQKAVDDTDAGWTMVEKKKNVKKEKSRPKQEYFDEYRQRSFEIPSSPPTTSRPITTQPSSSTRSIIPGASYLNGESSSPQPSTSQKRKKKQQKNEIASRPKTNGNGKVDMEDYDIISSGEFSSKQEDKEKDWQLPQNRRAHFKAFKKSVQIREGNEVGVQGSDNSCYMDSSLFALFSFCDKLDQFILKEDTDHPGSNVKNVLRNGVIFHMRHDPFYVPYKFIRKLRTIFAKDVNREYGGRFMDVEEFLSDLFKLIDAPPFIRYNNDEGDHIHQIAIPFTWDKSQYEPYLSLQSLLEASFETFDVKLEKMPDDLLIIKLPVSDGVLIPCAGVVPNLTLNLENVLVDCVDEEKNESSRMVLKAAICLYQNHFVSFVRSDYEVGSPWIYMDSKPTVQMPFVSVLNGIDQEILNAIEGLNHKSPDIQQFEPTCENYSLFRHAYVCIYIRQ